MKRWPWKLPTHQPQLCAWEDDGKDPPISCAKAHGEQRCGLREQTQGQVLPDQSSGLLLCSKSMRAQRKTDWKLGIRKKKRVFMMSVTKHWNRLPRKLINAHPWKHSRGGQDWETWRCSCTRQEGWATWPLKVLPTQQHSMILQSWLYDSILLCG